MSAEIALGIDGESVESIRTRYRPSRVRTLFVGESAPAGGTFFYCGNSGLRHYMEIAVLAAGLNPTGDFLRWFQSRDWYLDDLVLTPVNQLNRPERRRACLAARNSLAKRIADYRPEAIVSLLLGIKSFVRAAAEIAGTDAHLFAVPFAGNGQQARFVAEMTCILPKLPCQLQLPSLGLEYRLIGSQ